MGRRPDTTAGSSKPWAAWVAACRPARVLVAEADGDMRALLAAALRRDGLQVDELDSAEQLLDDMADDLLAVSGRAPPALVVTDLRLPGKSGLDVLAGLRRAGYSLPVVLITAFGDDEAHRVARRLGAAAVFDKPFDVDDFRTVVGHLLRPHEG